MSCLSCPLTRGSLLFVCFSWILDGVEWRTSQRSGFEFLLLGFTSSFERDWTSLSQLLNPPPLFCADLKNSVIRTPFSRRVFLSSSLRASRPLKSIHNECRAYTSFAPTPFLVVFFLSTLLGISSVSLLLLSTTGFGPTFLERYVSRNPSHQFSQSEPSSLF